MSFFCRHTSLRNSPPSQHKTSTVLMASTSALIHSLRLMSPGDNQSINQSIRVPIYLSFYFICTVQYTIQAHMQCSKSQFGGFRASLSPTSSAHAAIPDSIRVHEEHSRLDIGLNFSHPTGSLAVSHDPSLMLLT